MSTHIRPPSAADKERWEQLWRGYLQFYEAERSDRQFASTWDRILKPDGEIRCLLATGAEGGAVGLAHFLYHASAWSDEPVCYLQDLFVAPDHRSGGIGGKLIDAVAGASRERGASKLYWLTQVSNRSARLLYDKVGRNTGFIRYEIPLVP